MLIGVPIKVTIKIFFLKKNVLDFCANFLLLQNPLSRQESLFLDEKKGEETRCQTCFSQQFVFLPPSSFPLPSHHLPHTEMTEREGEGGGGGGRGGGGGGGGGGEGVNSPPSSHGHKGMMGGKEGGMVLDLRREFSETTLSFPSLAQPTHPYSASHKHARRLCWQELPFNT